MGNAYIAQRGGTAGGGASKIEYDVPGDGQVRRDTLLPWPRSVSRAQTAANANGDLVVGGGGAHSGNNNQPVNDVVLVAQNGVQTSLTVLSTRRFQHTATPLGDDGIIFSGGWQGGDTNLRLSSTEKYDLNGLRTALTPLAEARYNLGGVTLGNGNALIFMGHLGSGWSSNVAEWYAPSGIKTVLTPFQHADDLPFSARLENGNVLVGGAAKIVYQYDLAGIHTTVGNVPRTVGTYSGTSPVSFWLYGTIGKGTLLLIGRQTGASDILTIDSSFVFSIVGQTPAGLHTESQAAPFANRSVLVGGGGISGTRTDFTAVYRYSQTTLRETITPLSVGRNIMATGMLGNGQALFISGQTFSPLAMSTVVERYSPSIAQIPVPADTSFQFEEHAVPQTAPVQTVITVQRPNSGWVEYPELAELNL